MASSFSFEVKESDLLGRIGTLSVGGRRLETPCLFPVIHPVRQAVTTDEIKAMGFQGIMTNSLIMFRRRREEAIKEKIHRLLDFDGVFMTDSGGYQVLEYGGVDVDYRQIAEFQSRVGSNLAVTLDRPTGYVATRGYAKGTVDYSIKNALATLKEFGDSETTWIGPVQGGLYADLLRKSATKLVAAGFEFLALGSPTEVMENYLFSDLVKMIVATRRSIPYSVPLHLFGAGHPLTMALAVALGCDTFDSASYILFARQGRYMTEHGIQRIEEMVYLPCSCPSCNGSSVAEIREMGHGERVRTLAIHNLHSLRREVDSCKEAITEGRLWDLVEERASAHPMLFEAFLAFANERRVLEPGTPRTKDRGLMVRGALDLMRPELSSASTKLASAKWRTEEEAVLLVTGEDLPFSLLNLRAKSLPRFSHDWYKIHPILGVYPAELDFAYPFTQTVTAKDEVTSLEIENAEDELERLGYKKVLLVKSDGKGRVSLAARNRPKRRDASPSPRAASAHPRSPRHP